MSGLVPVLHKVTVSSATPAATAAMRSLLAGPNATEKKGKVTTQVPTGVTLHGVTIINGVGTADLSPAFASGTAAAVRARLAQAVYTLTQFPAVRSVRFRIDGHYLKGSFGAGVNLDHPVTRALFTDWLPAMFVDSPAYRATFAGGGRVSGLANVFEAQFVIQLIDAQGKWLYLKSTMASCGTGCWGTFSATISYTVSTPQWGTLKVWEPSAKDGKPTSVRSYPVWLTPAGK